MSLGLLGALGGAGQGVAAVGQQWMQDIAKREDNDYRAKLEEWRMAKQQEYEIAREDRKMAAAEAVAKRDAKLRIAADEGGDASLRDAAFSKFKRDLGQTDATDEQLKQLFDSQYYEQSVAPGDANSDRYNPLESDRLLSRRNEALKLGAGSGLLESYTKEIDGAKKAEKAARDEAYRREKDQREFDRRERNDRATEEYRDQQLALGRERLQSGGRSTDDSDKVNPRLKALYDLAMKEKPEPPKLQTSSAKQAYADAEAAWKREYGADVEAYKAALRGEKPSTKPADPTDTKSLSTPPLDRLKEGKVTTFANGQKWKLVNGKPVQVKD